MIRAARPLVSSRMMLCTVTTTGGRWRRVRAPITASQPALRPCAWTRSTPPRTRRSCRQAVARRPGDRLDGMATTSSRGRMPSMTPAGPASTTRQPRADSAAASAPTCRRMPPVEGPSTCRIVVPPARTRRRRRGDTPGSGGRVGHRQALRAPSRVRHERRWPGGRARAKTTAPARPPSTSATSALGPPRPTEHPGHGDHGDAGHRGDGQAGHDPPGHTGPPQLGQRSLRDDGEDDRADEVRPSVGRGQRRRPLAVGGHHRADHHGQQPGHGDQAVGQRRAPDVALRVPHPRAGRRGRTRRARA